MKRLKQVAGAVVFLSAVAASPSAHAEGCKLNGVLLDCGKGNDASKLEALADAETTALFADPLASHSNFDRPADLERYRRSLERTWRAVNRAERRQRLKMRRRQISASQFEAWTPIYDKALENYGAALTFYRTLVWHGKTGKAPPADN